jgi:hypothetical protein
VVAFNATGVVSPPASSSATGGTALGGFFGNYLAGTPEVIVRDAQGNPVAGVAVLFTVSDGGGSVTGANAQTDFLGRASPTSWRLGASGPQSVTATVPGQSFPPIVFNAAGSAPPAGTFKIEIRYPEALPTATQLAAFNAAAARWQQLILAGGPPYEIFEDGGGCGNLIGETVDGVVIMAFLEPIDGVGGVLGAAGACILRDAGFLPAQGIMLFDTADLPSLEGQLPSVILHEMAHVLGFGTIWNFDPGPSLEGMNAFLTPCPGSDPVFTGAAARAAFLGAVAPGTTFMGVPVPVEGSGGAGTRCSHWRESTFNNELMTGFLNPGGNPLSAVSVQSFTDLGYVVNDALADAYTFQGMIQAAGSKGIQLVEGVPPGQLIVINRQGRAVARIPRVLR